MNVSYLAESKRTRVVCIMGSKGTTDMISVVRLERKGH